MKEEDSILEWSKRNMNIFSQNSCTTHIEREINNLFEENS